MSSNHLHRIAASFVVATSLLGLCLSQVAIAVDKPAPAPVDGKIKWVYDYQEGQRLSRETGKPMFVVFRCER